MGRPRTFGTSEELEVVIDHYFNSITKTRQVFDTIIIGYEDEEKKKPITKQVEAINNAREPIFETYYLEIPSITGLCIHLGITKETWSEYSKLEMFSDSITRAKEKIERYNIDQLYRKEQVNGVIFNLKNNFGWKEKQEVENTNINLNNNLDLTGLSTEEIKELLKNKNE